MLTGKIPDWGLHRAEYRFGTHRIDRRGARRIGDGLGHARIFRRRRRAGAYPCRRRCIQPTRRSCASNTSARPPRHPAAWRCITSSALRRKLKRWRWRSVRTKPVETVHVRQGRAAARVRSAQCQCAADPAVDYVMLGCPHAALEQLEEAADLLDGSGSTRTRAYGSSRHVP